jgi:ferrous iron transport protein A
MTLRLTDLIKNQSATITGFDETDKDLSIRLREIGFAEGDNVTPLHFGLFGKNPISVRVNGALIALRRQDAKAIIVQTETEAKA